MKWADALQNSSKKFYVHVHFFREDGTTVIIQQAEGGEMVIAEDTLEQSIESDTPLHIATDGTVQVVSTEEEQVSTICQFAKLGDVSYKLYVLLL